MNRTLCTTAGRQRLLFALAGTLTLIGTGLTVAVSPWFALVPTFVAVNQLIFASLGACPASLILGRLCLAGER